MNKKIGVFGGDLFWSNLPYDLLNFYHETKVKNNEKQVVHKLNLTHCA